jgi:hypothetical protein
LTCCTAEVLPYQQRGPTAQSFGYSDGKMDALHYYVFYSDTNPDRAEKFMMLRAAQIAQGAGFAYYAFEKRGANSLKYTENDLEPKQFTGAARSGRSSNVSDMIPEAYTLKVQMHFNAWGQISLLTPDQAKNNPQAKQVSDVLAQFGSNLQP